MDSTASTHRLKGEVVYLYAFDIAYEMHREPVRELLGQPVAQFSMDSSRRNPRHLLFHQPSLVRMPVQERIGPGGSLRIQTSIKLLPIGAISIAVRVPFEMAHLEDLVAYHDLQFSNGALNDEVRRLAEEVRRALAPHIARPIDELAHEEAYTVFCLNAPVLSEAGAPIRAEVWLENHRRSVAALLTQEAGARLSRQEMMESTSRSLSYYEDDLLVIDWDAALLVDQPSDFAETIHILELANLQLAELEAYDRLLDGVLERSYRDLGENPLRRRADVLRELRELRIDMARFSDELSNLSKFIGDWHLARVYEAVAARFHLSDWHRAVDDKLKTMGELHQLLKADQGNRWMMILEATIVLLFIVDLVILFSGARK
ncbi:MAG: hypothetical protein J0L84_16005 [Verrucomicrobia bacterium]|nr:hypothetical protein [Verrucomicrobiota bacterium]